MNWAARLAEQGCRMIYVQARALRARRRHGVRAKDRRRGRGDRHLRARRDAADHGAPAAVRAHLPLVVFAGEAPLKSGWYNQELDQAPLITATGAAYHRLHMPERMPVAVRDAFLQARRERRPVVIGVPFDLQTGPGTDRRICPSPRASCCRAFADAAASRRRGQRREAACRRRAVVVLRRPGRGRSRAGAACRRLAARTGGLLSTTLPREGLFHDDPFCIGISGSFTPEVGLEYLKQADLVIAVGCSLAYHAGGGGQLWPKAKMLQIDIDLRSRISQGQEVAKHHLRADAPPGSGKR
jgi:thiamine pyrophosphate-dependent acetolactate synthase large subunit-like protein